MPMDVVGFEGDGETVAPQRRARVEFRMLTQICVLGYFRPPPFDSLRSLRAGSLARQSPQRTQKRRLPGTPRREASPDLWLRKRGLLGMATELTRYRQAPAVHRQVRIYGPFSLYCMSSHKFLAVIDRRRMWRRDEQCRHRGQQ